jgi:hypothetical protein
VTRASSPSKRSPTPPERQSQIYGDLTTFAGMLGDSFALRLDWLAQLIVTAHAPSLGSYKERLLRSAVAQFLPRRYEVGTGFVLFPTERLAGRGDVRKARQAQSHVMSRQLDLIVFDASEHPVVLREDDFVVLRPESVRSVVEIKGALDQAGVDGTVDSFIDYGRKWKECRRFYKANSLPKLPVPKMFLMAWAPGKGAKGYPKTDGKRLRKRILSRYQSKTSEAELPGLPLMTAAYLYGDAIVSAMFWLDAGKTRFGFDTERGSLVRYGVDGQPTLAGDKTVAALLAGIQWSLETPFNPMIAYVDQTKRVDVLPHKFAGFEEWLDDEKVHLVAPKHLEGQV